MDGWGLEGGGEIGSIVWVRRKNGKWWPGKILGPGELSECSFSSPRAGTPVKLLGREDASVEWYNLEKSKRVKAFRCGEFDDCIEKAESMPVKKREKYARREDAILHALELEKQLLGDQDEHAEATPRIKKLQDLGLRTGSDNGLPRASRFPSTDHNLSDWDDVTCEGRPSFKGQCENGRRLFNPMIYGCHNFGGRPRSMLVDVELEVRSSYPREHVPNISLLSKLNGRAIVGHPIQIEALEDGSSESLIIPKDECHIGEPGVLGSPTLTPSWKTARRSNYRVPCPSVSSVLAGDDSSDFPSLSEQERRQPFKKSVVSSLDHNPSLRRKGLSRGPRPSVARKPPRKSSKRASLSSSQKTRTLSSIGSQHGLGTKTVHDTRGCQMNGLIKSKTSGPTTEASIPVKLVFSRLLEKINRPPSRSVS